MQYAVMTWIGNPTDIFVYYGFHTSDEACSFGEKWQHDNEDNPCWQVVIDPSVTVLYKDKDF